MKLFLLLGMITISSAFAGGAEQSPGRLAGLNCSGDLGEETMSVFKKESLREAFERFLSSVKEKDFETFSTFFTDDLAFKVHLPGGRIIDNLPEFMESQRHYFGGTTGIFNYQVLEAVGDTETGKTAALVNYQNVDADGVPFKRVIRIEYRFQFRLDHWYLVHIENFVQSQSE